MPSFWVAHPLRRRIHEMYAIVATGGKQYKAEKSEVIFIDKVDGEPGATLELDDVVMVCDGGNVKIGSPYVKGAKVKAEIVRQVKMKKIEAFNYKPKKNIRKRWGHRQPMTQIRITEVVG
jgi:large subunit ribosomal protein L21